MSEKKRIAVILASHDPGTAPPTISDCQRILSSGPNSVVRYWQDNTENWFLFPAIDFFGPYTIELPSPHDKRATILDRAKHAAIDAGVNLTAYDALIVLLSPGKVDGVGYDAGALGIGPGSSAVLVTFESHTFFCHELGHVLGFDHTYGILNPGADWTEDNMTQLYPVYGDPYDLMSSASFGNASPTFKLPLSDAVPGFPSSRFAGPMLARAQLHFFKPGALEAVGKVRHVFENGDDEIVTLYPAGQGEAGKTELIVYHPSSEDARARGRVYVEYRQLFDDYQRSRWDKGLAQTGDERDRCGVIVHVVRDIPGTAETAVWYAGRLTFPSPDCDILVETPQGKTVITISNEFVQSTKPRHVRARINRNNVPRVAIEITQSDVVRIISTERRSIPGWE